MKLLLTLLLYLLLPIWFIGKVIKAIFPFVFVFIIIFTVAYMSHQVADFFWSKADIDNFSILGWAWYGIVSFTLGFFIALIPFGIIVYVYEMTNDFVQKTWKTL